MWCLCCLGYICWFKSPTQWSQDSPNHQDEQMPFPWTRGADAKRKVPDPAGHPSGMDLNQNPKGRKLLRLCDGDITKFPWYNDIALPCQKWDSIRFDVPKIDASAGSVLKHSLWVLDGIFKRNEPLIFKIGWTHSPIWRWTNKLYGYKKAQDGWSHMTVLFVTDEPYSPGMLEAALIEKYSSDLL